MADEESAATGETESVAGGQSKRGPDAAGWEFLEILAVVILVAESLRIVGSVVSGIIDGASTHLGTSGQQLLVGSAMQRAANFADGPGIVLLLVSLALLWWRAEHWTERVRRSAAVGVHDGALGAEAIQVQRLGSLARWSAGLFALAAVGAIAFLIGDILVNTIAGVTSSTQWQSYANDTFSVAYAVIALGGLLASLKLIKLCGLDKKEIDAAR